MTAYWAAFLALVSVGSVGGLTPPEGFAFVVDGEGNYVVDGDGAYVVTEI